MAGNGQQTDDGGIRAAISRLETPRELRASTREFIKSITDRGICISSTVTFVHL